MKKKKSKNLKFCYQTKQNPSKQNNQTKLMILLNAMPTSYLPHFLVS